MITLFLYCKEPSWTQNTRSDDFSVLPIYEQDMKRPKADSVCRWRSGSDVSANVKSRGVVLLSLLQSGYVYSTLSR
jgi:hypothetical protein